MVSHTIRDVKYCGDVGYAFEPTEDTHLICVFLFFLSGIFGGGLQSQTN